MRKTHETVLRAFLNGERRKVKNLMTDGQTVYLHNNPIIWRSVCGDTDQSLFVLTLAGWPTVTTRAVLNAFTQLVGSDASFHQRHYGQHVSGTILDFDLDGGNEKHTRYVVAMLLDPFDCIEVAA